MKKEFELTGEKLIGFIRTAIENRQVTGIRIKGHGGSMFPIIKDHDLLYVDLIKGRRTIKFGDIVAVARENLGIIVVHRVISKKNEYLIKGDNVRKNDGWFPKESIIGVISGIKRDSGRVIHYRRWQNVLIALLSRTNMLQIIIRPAMMFYYRVLSEHLGESANYKKNPYHKIPPG